METFFITLPVIPNNHAKYSRVDRCAEGVSFQFFDSLSNIPGDEYLVFEHPNSRANAWNTGLTKAQLLKHPDLIKFTEYSHPEYFI